MFRTFSLIAVTALMAGCGAQLSLKAPADDDPTNPQAPEAPAASVAVPLTLEPPPAAAADTGAPPPSSDNSMKAMDMKDMAGMPGMGRGRARTATQPSQPARDMEGMHRHSRSGPATQPAATQALYTCKMHPQVVSNQPGNCPICGMELVPKEGGK
jgi:hypothetical protein